MSNSALSSIRRGAVVGVIAGLFFGGVLLVFLGTRALLGLPDCTTMTQEQCALELEIALRMGRMQVMFGLGLALLGLSGFLYFRARSRRAADPSPRSDS